MKAPTRPFVFEAQHYPTDPGCYLMKDGGGRVIYVGKAKNLRRRLSSYFRPTADGKAHRLAAREIEVIVVNNETESLILENNLIKRHKPPYNVMLVDDNSGYGYLVLTGERYPRCVVYRKNRVNSDMEDVEEITPSRRFGPYVSRHYRDALQAFVNEYFGLRVCKVLPKKACLLYHIHRCSGICEQHVTDEAYALSVAGAAKLLSYHSEDLIAELKRRMREHAERLEYEMASKLRDQIHVLKTTLQKQVVERDVHHDQDIMYFGEGRVLVARVAGGAIEEARLYSLDAENATEEMRRGFLIAYYLETGLLTPQRRELIVNRLDDPQAAVSALDTMCGQRLKITVPKRGHKHQLLKLCQQNLTQNLTFTVHKLADTYAPSG